VVLEQLDRPGGGSRTEETLPGYRFDLHSAEHNSNIINMTDIPAELDLAAAGLVYQEMDPFSVAIQADGRRVRFLRSIEATVDSIAESSGEEARAYQAFMDKSEPIVRAMLVAIRGGASRRQSAGRLANAGPGPAAPPAGHRARHAQPLRLAAPALAALDLTRGPVAAFAAHAGVGPTTPGGAAFVFWQAAYHLFGQWHGQSGGRGAPAQLRVLPKDESGSPRPPPVSRHAARPTTSSWRSPAAMAGSQATRRVTRTKSWRSRAPAMAARAWPSLRGLAARPVRWW
jgi:beta-carotene ketolase (CrtO type)